MRANLEETEAEQHAEAPVVEGFVRVGAHHHHDAERGDASEHAAEVELQVRPSAHARGEQREGKRPIHLHEVRLHRGADVVHLEQSVHRRERAVAAEDIAKAVRHGRSGCW